MSSGEHRSLAESVEGSSHEALGMRDWGQLGLAALIFGSAFMWMSIAQRGFESPTIAFGRVALGAAALSLLPGARCRVFRQDWLRIAGILGFAAPFFLILLAQERIPSAVAGMTVSILPIAAALVAAIETRRWPRPARVAGLSIGLVGAGLLAAPNLAGTTAQASGILLALASVLCYAIASTIVAPLQQTYGALRVTMWLLITASLALLPFAVPTFGSIQLELASLGALLFLGIVGTGLVWALYVGLVHQAGCFADLLTVRPSLSEMTRCSSSTS